jgi:hypothetical protein
VVGLVHGLAGSAAVALLVLSTIKSPLWSTAYLLVFGFGTMAGNDAHDRRNLNASGLHRERNSSRSIGT